MCKEIVRNETFEIRKKEKKKPNRYEIIRTPSIIDDNFMRIAKLKLLLQAHARAHIKLCV